MSSNYWDLLMASSSFCGDEFATSFEISNVRDLKNRWRRSLSSKCALHKLWCLWNSWMWSDMCVVGVCLKWVRSSRPESWRTRSWKNVRNVVARELKLPCDPKGWYMYHFVAGPMRVRWNSRNQIVSATILLD